MMAQKIFDVYEVVISRYQDGRIVVRFPQDWDKEGFETQNHRIYAHQWAIRTVVRMNEFNPKTGQDTGNVTFIYAKRVVMRQGGDH